MTNPLESEKYLEVTYDTKRSPYGPYPRRLAKHLHETVYKKPGRLLDLGCGRGEYLDAFAALGYEVVGIDISPAAPKLSPQFDVRVSDMEHGVAFDRGTFDYVFSKSVIEHMQNPHALFSQGLAALKKGGTAIIMTPSWEHSYWGPFYIDHTHVTPFTIPSLTDAMAIAGYDGVDTNYFYQLPFSWRSKFFAPLIWGIGALPLPYRPYHKVAPWPDGLNKLIRFSKEAMLLATGKKK